MATLQERDLILRRAGFPSRVRDALLDEPDNAGGGPQIVEVTDLVIPAGTDWSSDHVVGVLPAGLMLVGRRVHISLYVRLDSPFPVADENSLFFGPFTSARDLQNLTTSVVLDPGANESEGYVENAGTLDSDYDGAEWEVHLATTGAVTAERRIEYARAAFLII